MIIPSLIINGNREEQVPYVAPNFPYYVCYEELSRYHGGHVPWHWHPDVEFIWIMQGSIRMCTSNHSFLIHAGEGAFINSNMLHYKEPVPGLPAISLNQVFDARIIGGTHKSIFDQKYVTPILECKELEAMVFHPSSPDQRRLLELIRHSYDMADHGAYGYELAVRNDLSAAWILLCQQSASMLHAKRAAVSHNEERIKKMLLFIHSHYTEKIALGQIAEAACISERECLRCFRENLNTTPFTYLLEYRTRMACSMLLETEKSMTEIALSCGFSDTSYFSKTFKKIINCMPSEYRALQQEQNTPLRFT